MMKFKIGDRVRMIDLNFGYAKLGESGTIVDITCDEDTPNPEYKVNFDEGYWFFCRHNQLELIKNKTTTNKIFPDELKEGEWYYTIAHGWCVCKKTEDNNYPFQLGINIYTKNGKFSKSNKAPSVFLYDVFEGTPPPKPLPKKGDLVYVWDDDNENVFLSREFSHFGEDGKCFIISGYYIDGGEDTTSWDNWSTEKPF